LPCDTANVDLVNPCCDVLVLIFRFPSENVLPEGVSSGLRVHQLLVGVSVVWSVDAKLVGVKLLPLPDWSAPKLPLLEKLSLNPFVP
jgi:hypothetical protein